ncbi:MAG: hypothetical protein L0H64_14425 [Pseudonocardia sp.]|nr:hypothetical protein [Pseudonocardia sp.]
MDTSKKLQASKVISAPPDEIFALPADPNRHAELDGAGMIRGVEGDIPPIAGIGQVFTMNMHADDLGDYRMINAVTSYVAGARVGWSPKVDPTCELYEKLGDMDASGHTYHLRPARGRRRHGGHLHLRLDRGEGPEVRGAVPTRVAGAAGRHARQARRHRQLTRRRTSAVVPRPGSL